jgi:hypothetical protein
MAVPPIIITIILIILILILILILIIITNENIQQRGNAATYLHRNIVSVCDPFCIVAMDVDSPRLTRVDVDLCRDQEKPTKVVRGKRVRCGGIRNFFRAPCNRITSLDYGWLVEKENALPAVEGGHG